MANDRFVCDPDAPDAEAFRIPTDDDLQEILDPSIDVVGALQDEVERVKLERDELVDQLVTQRQSMRVAKTLNDALQQRVKDLADAFVEVKAERDKFMGENNTLRSEEIEGTKKVKETIGRLIERNDRLEAALESVKAERDALAQRPTGPRLSGSVA